MVKSISYQIQILVEHVHFQDCEQFRIMQLILLCGHLML
jgi:hypothetical protein